MVWAQLKPGAGGAECHPHGAGASGMRKVTPALVSSVAQGCKHNAVPAGAGSC